MAKKDQLNIRIVTVPNGYMLDIEKHGTTHGFLYLSLDKLLEGFIYHIGFEELKAVSMEKVGQILEAAVVWKDNAQLVRQLVDLNSEVKTMKQTISSMERELEKKRDYAQTLRNKLAEKSKAIKELEGVLKDHPNWQRKIK